MEILINNINSSRFKATLMSRDLGNVTVTTYDDWLASSPKPIDIKDNDFSYSTITLKYFVEGVDEKDTLKNISNLINEHLKAIIYFPDLNLKLKTKFKSGTPKHIKDEFYEYTMTLQGDFKLDADKSVTLKKSGDFECTSNVKTPAVVTIKSLVDSKNVIIQLNEDEYIFESLKAGDVIIINGEDYTINLNGENNPSIVDLWSFPVLKSGINNFNINKETVSVNIAYTEMYI